MNCYRCSIENEAGAHYCKQCGADLWDAPANRDDGSRKSIIYVLILLGWEYFTYVVWFVLQRTLMRSSYQRSNFISVATIYKVVSWTFGGIELVLLVLFAVLAKNMTVRICLIAFMVIRMLLILAYAVSSFI